MTHIRNLIRSGIVSDVTIELKYANVVYAAELCATAGPGGAHRMGHASRQMRSRDAGHSGASLLCTPAMPS